MYMYQYFIFYGWRIFHCMCMCGLFLYSSVGGHLGYFHLWDNIRSTAIDMHIHGYVWILLNFFVGLKACRILVPQPRVEPVPLALEAWNLNHWTAGEVPWILFKMCQWVEFLGHMVILFNFLRSCQTIFHSRWTILGFLGSTSGKKPTCQYRRCRRCRFDPWVRKIPWRRAWQLTPVFLPGESHGQRSLVGYSPWGHRESDTTEVTYRTTQQHMRVPIFPHPPNSYYFLFFVLTLIDVKWYLTVLTWVSLKMYDVEHLFMCLLVICVSSLEKQMVFFTCQISWCDFFKCLCDVMSWKLF